MANFIDMLYSPLQYPFMVRGLLVSVIIGIVCATIGTYIVLRGMAFFGDALAHAILPGVAIGYLIGGGAREPLFWGALIAAMISSMVIGAISRNTNIREDTAIGIVFAGMFALGIALISTVRSYSIDLAHFLFGDILGISTGDLVRTTIIGILILAAILIFYKEFLVLSFDPLLAATLRLPARWLEYFMLALISVTIVVSLQAVGIALMVAMLITPAASAYLMTRRLPAMMLLAAVIASISGITGLYISYYASVASGAAIVLVCTTFFVMTWSVRSIQKRHSMKKTVKYEQT